MGSFKKYFTGGGEGVTIGDIREGVSTNGDVRTISFIIYTFLLFANHVSLLCGSSSM